VQCRALDESANVKSSKCNVCTGFFWSLRRLLTNRIIVLNTIATVCLQTAMANYLALEDKYLESKFFIPRPSEAAGGFNDAWTSRLTIGKLPVACHVK
jgi:hypothetical protein